jgi:hypothetical protein
MQSFRGVFLLIGVIPGLSLSLPAQQIPTAFSIASARKTEAAEKQLQ